LVNVSSSGAFLETALKLPLNASVVLEAISSAGLALERVKLAARVARVDSRGLGIEWRAMLTQQMLSLLAATSPQAASPIFTRESSR
jgi:hypothetical protein